MKLSISKLRDSFRRGDQSPEDFLKQLHVEIEKSQDDYLWTRILSLEEMMGFLGKADSEGDLYGVPFAIKDNIDLEGIPTTAGCPDYEYTPDQSATVVSALLKAGAIPVGKTNMDQFATGLVGTRSPYGQCRHGWHPESISGGSSSGSGVAVARGLCAFSLGTDTAGSGRVPASLNGIVGYKPTPGLVSMTGVVPACRSLDTVSVFTSEAEDLDVLLPHLIAKDELDPLQRVELRPGREGKGKVATMKSEDLKWVGRGGYEKDFSMALESLRLQGYVIEEVDLGVFSEVALMLYEGPWVAERYQAVGEFLESLPPSADPTVAKIIGGGASIPAKDVFANKVLLEERKRRALRLFDDYSGLLLPTIGGWFTRSDVEKDPIGVNSSLGLYTNFANLLELSACAFPIGESNCEGEPRLGLTLFGPGSEDETTIRKAREFRRALHWKPIAVCGAHLTGFPLNHQLTEKGAVFLEVAKTAPEYQMLALNEMKPALVKDTVGGASLEVEIWGLPIESWGDFMTGVSSPLGIGSIALDDGRQVSGFVGEAGAVEGENVTKFGGWRAFKSRD